MGKLVNTNLEEHKPSDDKNSGPAPPIAHAGSKKPWYTSPTIVISICALMFSVISGAVSAVSGWYTFQHAERQQDMDELQALAVQLTDNRKAILDILTNPSNQATAETLATTLNTKQKMLLSRADSIANSLSSGSTFLHFFSLPISPEITWTLGSEHQAFGEYPQALDFYKQAMQSGSSDTSHVFAPRALAVLYMLPATGVQSIHDGEGLFQNTIDHVTGLDDISKEIRGDTYYDWGTSEYAVNQPSIGDKRFDEAEKCYAALQVTNPDRLSKLQQLQAQREKLFGLGAGASIARKLVGTWAIADADSSGHLVISNDANSGQLIGNLSKHSSISGPAADAVFNELGTIVVQSSTHAAFNWKLQNGIFGMNAQGTTLLTIESGENQIDAAEPSSAPGPNKYTLKRVPH